MLPRPTTKSLTRLLSRIDASGGPGACWPWKGSANRAGYGKFSVGYLITGSHRAALEWLGGERVPDELVVIHECDNPSCCNPEHLRVGTQAENLADMRAKGRGSDGKSHGSALRASVTKPRGQSHHFSKFSDRDVLLMMALRALGATVRFASAQAGMSGACGSMIDRGMRRADIPRPVHIPQEVFAEAAERMRNVS